MRFVIEGGSPDFERDLLALLDKHFAAGTVMVAPDTTWTEQRAADLVSIMPPGTRDFFGHIVAEEGRADAPALRDAVGGDLRGVTGSLSKTVDRGARLGMWPQGMPSPITVDYGEKPNYRRAHRYLMNPEDVRTFRAAIDNHRS